MTGAFTIVTPEKCEHYARFMQHIRRDQADAIFWALFAFMIILLITASTMYTKASRTLSDPEKAPLDVGNHRKIRLQCLIISLVCFILAIGTVVMEAFAAFSIQFCDGEDLMMLYWGFWTLIQVGSLIAIFGIMLNQCYSLGEKEHPPWSVALGTPVLVIAALGHAWQSCVRTAWRRWTGKTKKATMWSKDRASMHRALTTPPHPHARHIGFSLTNEPIFVFPLQEFANTNTSTILRLTEPESFKGFEMAAGQLELSSPSGTANLSEEELAKGSKVAAGLSNSLPSGEA